MSDSYRTVSSVELSEEEGRRSGGRDLLRHLWDQFRRTWKQIAGRISFWTVVGAAVCLSTIYYYAFAESMYESDTILSVQNKSTISTGATSMLSGVLGSSAVGGQVEQLYQYITSPDMLKVLDKKFHLRQVYSSDQRNPFWRLWWPHSDDAFLQFYQNMIDVQPDTTDSLLTITVMDYSAERAHAIANEIVAQCQRYMNSQSAIMATQTMQFARDELAASVKAVEAAKIPYEQSIAEMRLSSAQQALATAAGLANQQQVFIIPVASPSYATNTTRPERLLDIAGIALVTALAYAVGFLMWANVRDHRS